MLLNLLPQKPALLQLIFLYMLGLFHLEIQNIFKMKINKIALLSAIQLLKQLRLLQQLKYLYNKLGLNSSHSWSFLSFALIVLRYKYRDSSFNLLFRLLYQKMLRNFKRFKPQAQNVSLACVELMLQLESIISAASSMDRTLIKQMVDSLVFFKQFQSNGFLIDKRNQDEKRQLRKIINNAGKICSKFAKLFTKVAMSEAPICQEREEFFAES